MVVLLWRKNFIKATTEVSQNDRVVLEFVVNNIAGEHDTPSSSPRLYDDYQLYGILGRIEQRDTTCHHGRLEPN
jgi:hypothetical protein